MRPEISQAYSTSSTDISTFSGTSFFERETMKAIFLNTYLKFEAKYKYKYLYKYKYMHKYLNPYRRNNH